MNLVNSRQKVNPIRLATGDRAPSRAVRYNLNLCFGDKRKHYYNNIASV